MKRCLILLAVMLSGSTASTALNYYFSDCASGGDGGINNPWCIDPPDAVACVASGDVWAAAMSDGCGTDAVAGDTIHLCIGGCGAAGQAGTVGVVEADTTNSIWMVIRMSGSSGSPITLQPFCTGGACDDVTISGDHDGDNVADSNEPVNLFRDSTAHQYWTIDGNPLVSGSGCSSPIYGGAGCSTAKYLHFTKSNGEMFTHSCGSVNCSWGNFIFEDFEASRTKAGLWTVTNASDYAPCTGSDPEADTGHLFKLQNDSGPNIWRRLKLHLGCKTIFRLNNNQPGGGHARTLEYNEVFNSGDGMDMNNFGGGVTFSYSIHHNYFHDLSLSNLGIGVSNATVADNVFECKGEFQVQSLAGGFKACTALLVIGNDNCANCGFGSSCDIHDDIIERNKLFARGEYETSDGGVQLGISVCQDDLVPSGDPNIVIRNNMLWHLIGNTTGNGCNQESGNAAIYVSTTDPVDVINNTVFDTRYGIFLSDAAHIATDNISARAVATASEFTECNNGVGSYTFNNIYDTSGNVACENTSNTGGSGQCDGGATQYSCAGIGSFGTSNKCAVPVFVKCDSATWCADSTATSEEQWDLHLHSTDTADKDAGTAGAADDIDQQSRPQGAATDIGGDEVFAADVTAPSAVSNLAATAPTYACITLTWTAPGDDAGTGTATTYDVRWAASSIGDDAAFTAATPVAGEPAPQVATSAESFQVCNLASSTEYFFAVKTSDEAPNTSTLSNSPSATTAAPPAGRIRSRVPFIRSGLDMPHRKPLRKAA